MLPTIVQYGLSLNNYYIDKDNYTLSYTLEFTSVT